MRQSKAKPSSLSMRKVPLKINTIKRVSMSPNYSDVCPVPHVARRGLQADVGGVLEGGLVLAEYGFLPDDAASADSLQSPAQRKDSPVALAQLNNLVS